MKKHDEVDVHECDICNKTFVIKDSLKQHIKRIPNEEEDDHKSCQYCGKQFTTVVATDYHMRKQHGH